LVPQAFQRRTSAFYRSSAQRNIISSWSQDCNGINWALPIQMVFFVDLQALGVQELKRAALARLLVASEDSRAAMVLPQGSDQL
jgi:hypothetical protein